MKKLLTVLAVLSLMLLAACGNGNDEGKDNAGEAKLKVGMTTDAGTIDDKSFNQGTWEGIKRAEAELGVDTKYLRPAGEIEAEYLKEIQNLYDAGYKFIITPGFKFETAIFKAQDKHEDAKFVIIDGSPHAGDFVPVLKDNTVAILFAEEQGGFIAGVATALELQEAEAGFIGGMQIPAVQKFNWGFQQGIKYANENLGTNIGMKEENFIYQGTFTEAAAGGQIAAQMYDRGVDVIFAAAGGVGVGVIQEAVNRAKNDEEVWVVGVDTDQYEDGKYEGGSIILTSAMKYIDGAAFDMIEAELNGEFPGGQTLIFDITNDGIGLPQENPNLSDDTMSKVEEVIELVKSGDIKVSNEQGDLFE